MPIKLFVLVTPCLSHSSTPNLSSFYIFHISSRSTEPALDTEAPRLCAGLDSKASSPAAIGVPEVYIRSSLFCFLLKQQLDFNFSTFLGAWAAEAGRSHWGTDWNVQSHLGWPNWKLGILSLSPIRTAARLGPTTGQSSGKKSHIVITEPVRNHHNHPNMLAPILSHISSEGIISALMQYRTRWWSFYHLSRRCSTNTRWRSSSPPLVGIPIVFISTLLIVDVDLGLTVHNYNVILGYKSQKFINSWYCFSALIIIKSSTTSGMYCSPENC